MDELVLTAVVSSFSIQGRDRVSSGSVREASASSAAVGGSVVDLSRNLAELLQLRDEEHALLSDLSDPPSGSELGALTEIREEVLAVSSAIVREVEGGVSRIVAAGLRAVFSADRERLGFCRIPAILDLRHEIHSHRLAAVVAPAHFPLLVFCRWVLQEVDPGPFDELTLSDSSWRHRIGIRVGRKVLPDRVLGLDFLALDWPLQRAVCDVARQEGSRLLIPVTAHPRCPDYASVADYECHLETGVRDRLHMTAFSAEANLSLSTEWDDEVLTHWLRRQEFWRDGLFPLRELRDALATGA